MANMNAATNPASDKPGQARDKLAALGPKIEAVIAEADSMGHSLLGIRLQESLDVWHNLMVD